MPAPKRPQVFVAEVQREGSCPLRLRSGDRLSLTGALLRTDGCRPCAYAICDLVPAARALEQALANGEKAEPATVTCSSCADPEHAVAFSLRPVVSARSTHKLRPDQLRAVAELKRFELLKPLPDATLLRIAVRMRPVTLIAGKEILRQGERGRSLFLIKRGEVSVQRAQEGASQQLARLGPGDCFGEMALLTGAPVSATIRSATSVELLILSQRDFQALLAANPGMHSYFTRLVAARIAQAEALPPAAPAPAGEIADLPVADLLQSLQRDKSGGRLILTRGDARLTVDFVAGQPVHVVGAGGLDEVPEEALYEVLHWKAGTYELDPAAEIVGRSFFKDLTALLIEAIRQEDEGYEEGAADEDEYYPPTPLPAGTVDGPSERGSYANAKELKAVMQRKQAAKADGRLKVRGRLGLETRIGTIWLSDGRIVGARLDELDGHKALRVIARIKSGEWAFGSGELPDDARAIGRFGVDEMFGGER